MLGMWGGTTFHWLLFERAISLEGAASSTVIYQCYPVLLILFLMWFARLSLLGQNSGDDKPSLDIGKVALILLSAFGVGLVVSGQAKELSFFGALSGSIYALSAALLAGASLASAVVMPDWIEVENRQDKRAEKRTIAGLYLHIIRNIIALIILAVLSLIFRHTYEALSVNTILVPVLGGTVDGFWAYFFHRANNLRRKSPSINALQNLSPILALLWLGIFASTNILRLDWFVVGALIVISANTLLHLDTEGRRVPLGARITQTTK